MKDKIPLTPENFKYLYDKYRHDISSFAVDIFSSPGLDDWQEEISRTFFYDDISRFYARASGHGTGKSFFAAIVGLHFLLFNPEVGIVFTSNTRSQLINKLGKEIHTQIRRSLIPDWFEPTATKIYRKDFNGKADPISFIELATNNPSSAESFSGLHSEAILFVADECSSLDPGIHQAILSSTPKQTENAIRRVLYFGNPLRSSGVLYDIFHNPKIGSYWDKEHLNSLNCRYADKEYCKLLIDSYGENSTIVRTRVYGLFPLNSADNLISPQAIDAAVNRELEKEDYAREPIIMGVDVARKGDDRSVIILRQGRKVYSPEVIYENTIPELSRRVMEVYRNTFPRPESIVVDAIGIGAGVYDILEEWKLPVVEFVASRGAIDSKMFANVRSETCWALKDFIETKEPSLPRHPILLEELRAINYNYNLKLQILIDNKDVIKKELGESPDLFDAVMLTMYQENDYRFRRGLRNVSMPLRKSRYPW